MLIKDLSGKKFGHLTVIRKSEKKSKSGSMWECKCDCGNIVTVARCGLISGHAKSCGCTRKKFLSTQRPAITHGKSRINNGKCERLYRVWMGMKERCTNPNHSSYERYGGRGVYVCDEWNDYSLFREWALSQGYDANAPRGKCTIDRINNDGPYAPWNCRWVDSHVQNLNKRRSN